MSDAMTEKIFSHLDRSLGRSGLVFFTVDGLSRELRMSKKTVYRRWSSKEALIRDYLFSRIHSHKRAIDALILEDRGDLDTFMKVLMILVQRMMPLILPLMPDLQLHYPGIWDDVLAFRRVALADILQILKKLERRGLTNAQVPAEQMVYILLNIIQSTIQPNFFTEGQYSPRALLISTLRILLEGCFTEEAYSRIELMFQTIEREERPL